MNLTERTLDGATVVTLDGELDGHSATIAEDIGAALRRSPEVVLDLSGVRYMSSAGLRVMLTVYRQAQCLGTCVAVVGLSDELRMLMRATGFLTFFQVADSAEAALRAVRGRPSGNGSGNGSRNGSGNGPGNGSAGSDW